MEGLELVELLADAGELDGPGGDLGHRQRGTAAGVAVELGQDDAGEVDGFLEGLGDGDGFLADHRVDDEQRLDGVDGGLDVGRLLHHLLIDVGAPGGVDDDHGHAQALGLRDRVLGHLDRIALGEGGVDGHADPFAQHPQLLDGSGALQVAGDQHRLAALPLQVQRQLPGGGRLPGALQAGQHDHRGGGGSQVQRRGLLAEDRDELLVHDLDDLLTGVEGFGDLNAHGALADAADEGLDDLEVDVGLEQGEADLAQALVDLLLGQALGAPEAVEDGVESVLEGVEHGIVECTGRDYAGRVPTTPPTPRLTLYVPRAIPVVVLSLAMVWSVPLVVALVSRRPVGLGFQLLNGLIALGLVTFGLDTALIRVVLTPASATVRRGLRRTTVDWDAVKGVALLQDGGVPRLRLVTHDDPVEVPAWSLRARRDDGEVEAAADALPRFTREQGIRLRVHTLAGPPRQG